MSQHQLRIRYKDGRAASGLRLTLQAEKGRRLTLRCDADGGAALPDDLQGRVELFAGSTQLAVFTAPASLCLLINWSGNEPSPAAWRVPLLSSVIGLGAAGALALLGHPSLAVVVGGLAVLFVLLALTWPQGSRRVFALLGAFGKALARGVSYLLLTPVYLLGFSAARLLLFLTGRDPLHLTRDGAVSYWQPSAAPSRKARYISNPFCVREGRARGASLGLWGLLLLVPFFLLLAEATIRLYGYGVPLLYLSDPLVGYYPAPNQDLKGNFGRYVADLHLNAQSMRRGAFALHKSAGTTRIFMLGDSTLFGGYKTPDEGIFARRVERLLNEQLGRPVEVLNMGVNGWGPLHELGYVKRFGTFEADLAVVCLPIGDIMRGLTPIESTPFWTLQNPPALALEELFAHVAWLYRENLYVPAYGGSMDARAVLGIEAYVELARLLREKGARVVFAIQPYRASAFDPTLKKDEQRRVAELRLALVAAGFDQVWYAQGLFAGKGKPEELYSDDCHLVGPGHALYGDWLAGELKTLLAAPAKAEEAQR